MSSTDIVVLGAGGLVGRRVVAELLLAGPRIAVAGRRESALEDFQDAAPIFIADARDPASLAKAFAGAQVVVNCAAPLRETAAPVLTAAIAAGAHYVDLGGDQAVAYELYERHESATRHAGLVALPGAGLDCMIGDLAASWAASHLAGGESSIGDGEAAVRRAPAARVAEDHPLDEVCTSYVFDDLVLSAGSQRALFDAAFGKPLVWRRDRWEAGRAGERRRVNAGPELGGERDAVAYGACDAITIPRHVASRFVASYASTTRHAAAAGALRLLARALPMMPKRAATLFAPYAPPDTDYTRTQLAVVTQARRGFSAVQIVISGHDLYRTTAVATAWAARQLVDRGPGPVGVRAPGELFIAHPALREIAALAGLTIEPSFGS